MHWVAQRMTVFSSHLPLKSIAFHGRRRSGALSSNVDRSKRVLIRVSIVSDYFVERFFEYCTRSCVQSIQWNFCADIAVSRKYVVGLELSNTR